MFNLEQSLTKWRRDLLAAGLKSFPTVNELENHLREEIRLLVSTGKSEARAFELAVARLGRPGILQTEFNKLNGPWIMPVKIGFGLWLVAMLLLAVRLAEDVFAGRNLLLAAHILAVTAGYFATYLVGSFGIYYACFKQSRHLSPFRRRSLTQAVRWIGQLALGLVIGGMLLGVFVSKQHFGAYWRWDPKEIGGLCVCAWLAALGLAPRLVRISESLPMLMGIGGNIVVSLAWFGAGMIDYHRAHGGPEIYWPLLLLLAIQFGFILLALRHRDPVDAVLP